MADSSCKTLQHSSPNVVLVCSSKETERITHWTDILLSAGVSAIHVLEEESGGHSISNREGVRHSEWRDLDEMLGETPVALFIHDGDRDLLPQDAPWYSEKFVFNSTGQPNVREGELGVYRETSPFFDVEIGDVRSMIEFASGARAAPPPCCFGARRSTIDDLVVQCAAYLAAHSSGMRLSSQGQRGELLVSLGATDEILDLIPSGKREETEANGWWVDPYGGSGPLKEALDCIEIEGASRSLILSHPVAQALVNGDSLGVPDEVLDFLKALRSCVNGRRSAL